MKITKRIVEDFANGPSGMSMTASCQTPSEAESAYRIAVRTRKELGMTPEQLTISRSLNAMTVTMTKR